MNFSESSSSISIMYLKMKESQLFGLNRQSYTVFLQADRLKIKGAFRQLPFTSDSFTKDAVNETTVSFKWHIFFSAYLVLYLELKLLLINRLVD